MRVLIADDHRMVAASLAAMVKSFGHEVVGVANSGLDAIKSYSECSPDVVLMDFAMSKLNGATASRMIVSHYPSAKIVMLSGYLNPGDMSSMGCGVIAGLQKPFPIERLKKILDEVEAPATA